MKDEIKKQKKKEANRKYRQKLKDAENSTKVRVKKTPEELKQYKADYYRKNKDKYNRTPISKNSTKTKILKRDVGKQIFNTLTWEWITIIGYDNSKFKRPFICSDGGNYTADGKESITMETPVLLWKPDEALPKKPELKLVEKTVFINTYTGNKADTIHITAEEARRVR